VPPEQTLEPPPDLAALLTPIGRRHHGGDLWRETPHFAVRNSRYRKLTTGGDFFDRNCEKLQGGY
jgi:hypothetical protein